MLRSILVDGKIPHFRLIKRWLFWFAWCAPLSVFFLIGEYKDFGQIGWTMLVGVLAIRPLADILPDVKIVRAVSMLRREFGTFAGMMLAAHFTGYLMANNINVIDIFSNNAYWQIDGIYTWGILGIAAIIPVLLTSSNRAKLFVKSKWKSIQRLVYLALLFGGIHIAILGKESGIIGVSVVAVLWTLARLGFKVRLPNS